MWDFPTTHVWDEKTSRCCLLNPRSAECLLMSSCLLRPLSLYCYLLFITVGWDAATAVNRSLTHSEYSCTWTSVPIVLRVPLGITPRLQRIHLAAPAFSGWSPFRYYRQLAQSRVRVKGFQVIFHTGKQLECIEKDGPRAKRWLQGNTSGAQRNTTRSIGWPSCGVTPIQLKQYKQDSRPIFCAT